MGNWESIPTQKGFVPTNGCHEHGYIASAVLNQTKRKRRQLYQVWYDLENAFGNVDHSLLFHLLEVFKLPPLLVKVLRDIYTEALHDPGEKLLLVSVQ